MNPKVVKYGAVAAGVVLLGLSQAFSLDAGLAEVGWFLLGWAGFRRPGDKS